MVPAPAPLRPPPPATLTNCWETPVKASAPPAAPFRSGASVTAPTNDPLAPIVALALPLNGQYETSVALFLPPHALSSKSGARQPVPKSVPDASKRHSAL